MLLYGVELLNGKHNHRIINKYDYEMSWEERFWLVW